MRNSIDSKKVLLIFQHIIDNGENKSGKYNLDGLSAWTDFDGYTCYVSDGKVTVTIFFHNKYNVEFEDESALTQFEKKLTRLAITLAS